MKKSPSSLTAFCAISAHRVRTWLGNVKTGGYVLE